MTTWALAVAASRQNFLKGAHEALRCCRRHTGLSARPKDGCCCQESGDSALEQLHEDSGALPPGPAEAP